MTTEDELIYSTESTTSVIYSDESTTSVTYPDESTTTVILRNNCSVYNPCGQNGYCRDNSNEEWTCICKFWWNGTSCNELSSSGKQVITLGVLVGILIIVFHGWTVFRSIRKKQKLSKTDTKQKTSSIKRTFPAIPISNLHPSRRLFSWITGILTLILATGTLLAKWSILKPIHEEIVYKFHNNQSLFFKRHSVCLIIDLTAQFNLFTFPVACLLIILLTIITKRIAFHRNKYCKGYIGIPIPIDFFAHVKRTLAAVIFAIFADELLEIVSEIWGGGGGGGGRGVSINQGVILSYLFQIVRVLIIGLRRYPILAAVYIDNCISLICATLYVWLDYSVTIFYMGQCRNDYYLTDQNFNENQTDRTIRLFEYFGTGSMLLFLQLLTDIPRYLCLAYISIKLPMLLIKRIRERKLTDRRLTREQKNLLYSSLPYSTESQYVKKLLGMSNTQEATNRFVQITRHIYTWRDDFRYSSRVLCIYGSLFLLLFFLTVEVCVEILPWLDEIQEPLQEIIDIIAVIANPPDPNLLEVENPPSDFPLPNLVRSYLFAVFISLIITIAQLLVMLAGIRRNLLQAYRGDPCELPRRTSAQNISYITGNFHFAGYLIGYVILAYIFLIVIATILTIAIDSFITFRSVKFLETILKGLIPFVLFILFKLYLNKLLGRYVFLQHGAEVLSINNRRAFMVFLYFNCFLDAFMGLLAAIARLFKSIVGGIVYMCRLDYSPLGRKLETMDAGFNAYCGFIYIECVHRHPVLLCFVSHLLRDYLYPSQTKRLSKAKHKWRLAVFLLNNPILIYRRKGFLTRAQGRNITAMLISGQNLGEKYIERPPILAHRASIISERALDDLWEQRRF